MTLRTSQYVSSAGQAAIASENVDAEAVPIDVAAGQGSNWSTLDGALEDIAGQLDVPDLAALIRNALT